MARASEAPPRYSDSPPPVSAEEHVALLKRLITQKLKEYARAKTRAERDLLSAEIVGYMRKIAAISPDAKERAEYAARADQLEKAQGEEKDHILKDIGVGLGLILLMPFIAAGGILYGVGSLVKGIGNLLTGGALKGMTEG
ncbi:MFS general substrate transporter [Mycena kentingensis (nom. inval.)]|nr:MFS general substrate transporter [Mycena kentingensis (nom. inval.)]